MTNASRTAPQQVLKPLAAGTRVFTIGTFYEAEVVTSQLVRSARLGWIVRTTVRWTKSIPAARVFEGDETTYTIMPGRTPRFIVGADQ
ncbi:hypothetical protein ACFU0X_20470 [Streptomyces cellulosae]|uniref:Uncharacterized protein n=1 Tax=Streptomyces cellulosae TaxID=1968 RepID=A0ABW6JK21_STRCE